MRALAPLALALAAPPVAADTLVTQTGANAVRADFALPTPDGRIVRGSFFLDFAESSGLTPANLNVRARLVDPADPALLARFPGAGAGLSVPEAFPVMVSVSPLPGSGFAFSDAVAAEMYTKALAFTADSPFRVLKAPAGGAFNDQTTGVIEGSVRIRVRTHSFSDFLVVADTRPAADAARAAYARLSAKLDDGDVPAATRGLLQIDLDESFEEFLEGDYEDARDELDAFELAVSAEAGVSLPNVWRAAGDLDNVAGALAADAQNLDFHLARLATAEGDDDEGDDD
ncbi:MAG TPA: hypothetical protein DCM32_09540 [Xanthomonadaceae bacterium]|jgi:hypothetical protein|nr:hypothetical protein [Xanthomonadaceae bacterium]